MKVIDPFAGAGAEPPKDAAPHPSYTYTADRVLLGLCPEDARPLVVFNDGQSWPLAACSCGWRGATTELRDRVRAERTWDGGQVSPA